MKIKVALFEISDYVSSSKQYSGIGLGYIKAYCKTHNPDTKIKIFRDSNVLEDIVSYSPKIIGISAVSYFYENAVIVAKILRERIPNVVIIIGGNHITSLPSSFHRNFDFGVIGEGEKTTSELLSLIKKESGVRSKELGKEKLKAIKGICYFNSKNKLTINPKREPLDMDLLPHIDRSDFDNSYYSYALSSRGCMFNCEFCGNKAFFKGNRVRLHSALYLYEEVKRLFDMGNRKITICDEMFVYNIERLIEFKKLLKKNNLLGRISFTCFLKHELITNKVCQILKELNVDEAWIEIDSFTNEGIKRDILNQKSLATLSFYKIKINCIFTINNLNESSKDIGRLREIIKKNLSKFKKIELKVNPVFPGTSNYSFYKNKIEAIDWIFINRNLYLLFSNNLYINRRMLTENEKEITDLIDLVNSINRDRFSFIKNKLSFFLNHKNKIDYLSKRVKNILYYKLYLVNRPTFPKELSIRLTNSCNLKCSFCLNKEYRNSKKSADFSYSDLHKIIFYLANNKMTVYLSGGEPLLNKDIFKVIKLLRLNNIHTYMFTNGFLLDRYYEKLKLSMINSISISVDHCNANIHDLIRNQKGLFDKIISNLEMVKNDKHPNIEINIATVINRDNYKNLSDIYSYFAALGFVNTVIFQKTVFLTGSLKKLIDKFNKFKLNYSEGELIGNRDYFNKDEIREIDNQLKTIGKLSWMYKTKVEGVSLNHRFLSNYYSDKSISNNSRCRGAFEHLHILGREISLWCGFRVANLDNDYHLERGWNSDKIRQFQSYILKKKIPHCQKCTKIDIKF